MWKVKARHWGSEFVEKVTRAVANGAAARHNVTMTMAIEDFHGNRVRWPCASTRLYAEFTR
jgi:hypothetical protein